MQDDVPLPALSDCEICSHLAEVETSFSKYGWEDMTRSLPPAAARLLPAEDISTGEKEHHHVKCCPLCGTFYQYDFSYEYLVNGSEDEEVLTRLTPDQARRFLSDRDYAARIAQMQAALAHPGALTRSYAAKCLVSHHLERRDPSAIVPLLTHPDADVVRGALAFLARRVATGEATEDIFKLQPVFTELATTTSPEVAEKASYIATQLAQASFPPRSGCRQR